MTTAEQLETIKHIYKEIEIDDQDHAIERAGELLDHGATPALAMIIGWLEQYRQFQCGGLNISGKILANEMNLLLTEQLESVKRLVS